MTPEPTNDRETTAASLLAEWVASQEQVPDLPPTARRRCGLCRAEATGQALLPHTASCLYSRAKAFLETGTVSQPAPFVLLSLADAWALRQLGIGWCKLWQGQDLVDEIQPLVDSIDRQRLAYQQWKLVNR